MICPIPADVWREIQPLIVMAEEMGGAVFCEVRRGTYPDTGAALIDCGVLSNRGAVKIRKVLAEDSPKKENK